VPGLDDDALLRQAIELSRRSTPSPSAFSVGCLLARPDGVILAAGYSRQDGSRVHAEEAALRGLPHGSQLGNVTLYSSMEPCGERASAAVPCADLIIAAGIRRVVIAWREPVIFVPVCRGLDRLRAAGVTIRHIAYLTDLARQANGHLVMQGSLGPLSLRQRRGERAVIETGPPPSQLTQNGSAAWQQPLLAAARELRGVRVGGSHVCLPGTRAFHLESRLALGPVEAFMADTEFAHLHPDYDTSVHLCLPPLLARHAGEQGWAVPVPPDGSLLVPGPRDAGEASIVLELLARAYRYARGTTEP
jgi:diaminohydroxyphosphoribosylaminopyrimidine deaminase / 5-amino-6-(5-phosphoribosylamino)uracil reductase